MARYDEARCRAVRAAWPFRLWGVRHVRAAWLGARATATVRAAGWPCLNDSDIVYLEAVRDGRV